MPSLASSPIAPVLGQRLPVRGAARLLNRSYRRSAWEPGHCLMRVTSKLGDDFDIDLSSYLDWQIWAFGSYEGSMAELFGYLVRPGERCVDVGANIGVHTVRLGKLVGSEGEVIAIEASAGLARQASSNALLNGLSNVRIIHAAACERGGDSVLLYQADAQDRNRARSSMLPQPYLTGPAEQVPTVTIDDVNDRPVSLIKIDVEGCESAVVAGAARTIGAYSPSIVFEYAPGILISKSGSPFGWLQDRGYVLFQIRCERHVVTGRGRLRLRRITRLPDGAGNLLAASAEAASRLGPLVT